MEPQLSIKVLKALKAQLQILRLKTWQRLILIISLRTVCSQSSKKAIFKLCLISLKLNKCKRRTESHKICSLKVLMRLIIHLLILHRLRKLIILILNLASKDLHKIPTLI